MGEWKRIKLSEVLKEKTERNKNNETDLVLSVTNSQGFVKQSDFFEGTVHSEDISNYKLVRKNEFAYNPSRINVGSIDILKEYDIGALSPMYVIFSVDETKLLPDYFKYYFQTHKFNENVKNNTQGSVRNSLSFKALSEFEYLLPPLEEQKRIVKILDQVNSIIEKYQSLINEKEQFIKSQFVEMFKDEKNIIKLNDFCNKITDGSHNPPKGCSFETDCMMLSAQNIDDRGLNYDDIRFLSQEDYEKENQRTNIQKGDLLYSIVGTIGKSYIVKEEKNIVFQRSVAVIKLKDNINRLFIKYTLDSEYVKKQIDKISKGNAQKGIYLNDLKNIKVPVSTFNKQKQFASIVELIDKQKFHSVLKNIIKVKESGVYV